MLCAGMPIARCPNCDAENDLQLDLCFSCGHALAGVGPGSVIADRLELLVQVGSGGMGWVFRAHDRLLDEEVGVKVLRPDLASAPDIARRFREEIRLARRVSHPNVCRIFEYGEDAEVRYITMEFVDGVDLVGALQRRGSGFEASEAFAAALGIAAGLEAIHEEGIVHRDLKSQNVMIDAGGVVRLLDFGIAGCPGRGLTGPGLIMGTPEYMSPEQCRSQVPDARSDIYSLAIVCYEIFTGSVPFRGASTIDTLRLQLEQPPPLDEARHRGLPAALVKPLSVALAKDPAARYASVGEFLRALREAQLRTSARATERVRSIPSSDRRRDRRLELPIGCRIRFAARAGGEGEERTITENISRGGARIKTAQTHLAEGDRLGFEEIDGPFRARAEVRGSRAFDDGIHRLHLKFLDHAAPARLVGEGEPRGAAASPP